ncbi:MAG: CRISPR system precrRNA processing endoribonuclease RAMP protein Cas6 [Calditrichaeota bacterium]|nr:CRISPR system precrRNA processing endoribonuclease RAMP protein Cas6 [Calditrichota bacterium]
MYLNLILIGKAIDYLPYFVYCFQRMGKEGIGRDAGKFSLEEVRAVSADGKKQRVFHIGDQVLVHHVPRIELDAFRAQLLPQATLQFLTPTCIKQNGKVVEQLTFSVLLKAILRRYHRLRFNHDDGQREDFSIDWEAAERIAVVHQEIEFQRFRRYSNRQGRPVPMEGFVGKVIFRGNLTPFYPWLKIGEYLHIGKGATFGMGWYRVVG